METVVQIKGLKKQFGKKTILPDLHLDIRAGEVFGFLGPNGAGKTTTIKILVGLLNADEGTIEICGKNVEKDFVQAMKHVGALVENPELYKYMSGMANLKHFARMRGAIDQARLDEVVELVGLSNRINEKVKKYSLGMKQRLGLAITLLSRPKVLILDEPTNGLDPAGIKHLRDILKKLAHEEGVCVLVSSHLMSEMELMCDRVGIIAQGKLIAVQTVEGLKGDIDQAAEYIYRVGAVDEAILLVNAEFEMKAERINANEFTVVIESDEVAAKVNRFLILNDIALYSAHKKEASLEESFLAMTEGGDQIA